MSRNHRWALAFLVSLILYINAVDHDLATLWRVTFVAIMAFSFVRVLR